MAPGSSWPSHARGVAEGLSAGREPICFRHSAVLHRDLTVLDHLECDLVLHLLDAQAGRRLVFNDEDLISSFISVAANAAVIIGGLWWSYSHFEEGTAGQSAAPPPQVVVSTPLQRELDTRMGFLGQFSAIDQVEIRAQVGGTLTEIHFKDGDVVHKGDLLFVIDPVPYGIKLAQANAQPSGRVRTEHSCGISLICPYYRGRQADGKTGPSTNQLRQERDHDGLPERDPSCLH